MSQMDLLVTNVAELLTAAVQEVLQLMGQAVSEYQKEAARTQLENQKLQMKLKELQVQTALVSDDFHSGEHLETEDLIYHGESSVVEKEQSDSLSDRMSFIEENSSPVHLKLVLDDLPVEDHCHSLHRTCANSLKKQRLSQLRSSSPRSPNLSSPGINEVTCNPEKPLHITSSNIKVESKPELLGCSYTEETTGNVTTDAPAFSILETSLFNESNQLPVSTSVVSHNQTHKLINSTSGLSEHILRSRIENTVDVHNPLAVSGRRENSHSCHVCGKTFANSSSLGAHFVCHSNERPFVCKCCNFRFSRLADLKKHERIHTGERPYKCSLCGRKFNRTENLKRHLRKIHYGAVI